MSLKAIHILFVLASISLAIGFGGWGVRQYTSGAGGVVDLAMGIGSIVLAIGLLVYGKYFLKKLKHISYL